MSGPEHYRKSQQLLAEAMSRKEKPGQNVEFFHSDGTANLLAAAQVHATLALAAATATATALHALTQHTGMGMVSRPQAEPWQTIVTPKPSAAGERS
jgi:hypothetical protein